MSADGRWFAATCGAGLAKDPIGRQAMLGDVRKNAKRALGDQDGAMIVIFVEDGTQNEVLESITPALDGSSYDPERDAYVGEGQA